MDSKTVKLRAAQVCTTIALACIAGLANEAYNQRSEYIAPLFAGTFGACALGTVALTIRED